MKCYGCPKGHDDIEYYCRTWEAYTLSKGGLPMKLSDFTSKPLNEALSEMELKDLKIHTDDDGNVRGVEVVYTPKEDKK